MSTARAPAIDDGMRGAHLISYPNELELLGTVDVPYWIDKRFLRQDPYAFSEASLSFHETACDISQALDVERNGIFCIGSGAVGLSLNPTKMVEGRLKRFDRESDLDMAIVSGRHFELAWRELLQATQPHLREVPNEINENINWQRKRLFDGAILSNKLLGSFSFGPAWIAAMDRIGGQIEVGLDRSVKIELWIYRDYWSLRNYIGRGLVSCQTAVKVGV